MQYDVDDEKYLDFIRINRIVSGLNGSECRQTVYRLHVAMLTMSTQSVYCLEMSYCRMKIKGKRYATGGARNWK
jgi:4-aminobutyrate aminotransferase-like enzyme